MRGQRAKDLQNVFPNGDVGTPIQTPSGFPIAFPCRLEDSFQKNNLDHRYGDIVLRETTYKISAKKI
jgi:hypothetical protein